MPQITTEEWQELWKKKKDYETERREKFRKALLLTPPPVPDKYVGLLVRLPDADFQDIMRDHPAYRLAQRRASYRTSISIMELSHQDLMAAIDDFAAKATDDDNDLLGPLGKDALEVIERRIQKELFATAGAAASLVDHCRRVTDIVDFPERDAKLAEHFGSDGLHNFIKKLRNILHHVHLVEAGWNVHYGFGDGSKHASFRINKEALLRVVADNYKGGQRAELEAFIKLWPEDIVLKGLFMEYRRRLLQFYEWFDAQLASESLVELRDYDRIMLEKRKQSIRNTWNFLLAFGLQTKAPIDPHNHLQNHLPPEAIAEVNKLPKNSREQADLIIKIVDKENAIDDDLKKKVYELFDRALTLERPPKDDGAKQVQRG